MARNPVELWLPGAKYEIDECFESMRVWFLLLGQLRASFGYLDVILWGSLASDENRDRCCTAAKQLD